VNQQRTGSNACEHMAPLESNARHHRSQIRLLTVAIIISQRIWQGKRPTQLYHLHRRNLGILVAVSRQRGDNAIQEYHTEYHTFSLYSYMVLIFCWCSNDMDQCLLFLFPVFPGCGMVDLSDTKELSLFYPVGR